jgi:hypothetical protein
VSAVSPTESFAIMEWPGLTVASPQLFDEIEPTEPHWRHPLGCSAAKRSHSETVEISALSPPAAMPNEAPHEIALSGLQRVSATSFAFHDFLSSANAAFNSFSARSSTDHRLFSQKR